MTQRQLHQSVARATGEDLAEINRRGFSELPSDPYHVEPDPEDLIIDWDELQRQQRMSFIQPRVPERLAA